jgi:hypothetical protein
MILKLISAKVVIVYDINDINDMTEEIKIKMRGYGVQAVPLKRD